MNICGIPIKTALRCAIFFTLAAGVWRLVPVPSKATPEAEMALNTWANTISPQIAAWVFEKRGQTYSEQKYSDGRNPMVAGGSEEPSCSVRGADLLVFRHGCSPLIPDCLTFRFDNIVAICVRVWIVVMLYLAIFECGRRFNDLLRLVCAGFVGAVAFSLAFTVRSIMFGYIVYDKAVETIRDLDDPMRCVLFTFMVVAMILVGTRKRSIGGGE